MVAELVTRDEALPATTTSSEFIEFWNQALEGVSPLGILRWSYKTFDGRISLACSFSGPTGMVLLDMTSRLNARPGWAARNASHGGAHSDRV